MEEKILTYKEYTKQHNTLYDSTILCLEGIDIDYINRVVKINHKHNKGVDLSLDYNPTVKVYNNIEIYSIFKRNKDAYPEKLDGNPLIYALKGIDGWTISEKDKNDMLLNFKNIVLKLNKKFDTILTIPSSYELNTMFLHKLSDVIPAQHKLKMRLVKKSASEIYMSYLNMKNLSDEDVVLLEQAFEKMIKYNKDKFSYKYIPTHLRNRITNAFTPNKNDTPKDIQLYNAKYINDKDILLIDDVVSTSKSVSDCVKLINEMYTPKSVTVVTLFSDSK